MLNSNFLKTRPNSAPSIQTQTYTQNPISSAQTQQQPLVNNNGPPSILDEIDPINLFANTINDYALSNVKIKFALRGIQKSIDNNKQFTISKNWPIHIFNKVKTLDITLQNDSALKLAHDELTKYETKHQQLQTQLNEIFNQLILEITQILTINFDKNIPEFVTSIQPKIELYFNNRVIQHTSVFVKNQRQNDSKKQKRDLLKKQNISIDNMDTDDSLETKIKKLVLKEINSVNKSKTEIQQNQPLKKPRKSKTKQKPNSKTNSTKKPTKKDF
jgi:hypothetical protein